jgi:hypothetical protein
MAREDVDPEALTDFEGGAHETLDALLQRHAGFVP